MSNFKIPKHLSGEFNRSDVEARKQLVTDYKNWYSNPLTELLIKDLEKKYETLLHEYEDKNDFVSLFQSKYHDAKNKAERKTLRTLLEQLDYSYNG